ncbi:MAG: GldG family protein [Caulobacterales bacterium]
MGRKTFAALVSIALVALFIIAVTIATPFARVLRIDLTEAHLYSLSDGARKTLQNVAEPTPLTLYYSRKIGAKSPELRAHAARVREMLAALAAASNGKISVREIDPQPFSAEEDAAIASGLEPAATPVGEQVYLGVAGKSALGQNISIPFLDPKRDSFLEYDLTRLVAAIDSPKRTKIALVTSLPLKFGPGGPAAFAQNASRAFNVYDEMDRTFDIDVTPPDFTSLPKDADILVIAHPWPLTPQQLFAIDQFVLAKGRALIMLDPATWIASPASGAAQYAAPQSSDMRTLFDAWGINLSNNVIADKDRALPIEVTNADGRTSITPQPLFLRLAGPDLSKDDPVTASLPRGVHVALPGALSLKAGSAFKMTPILQTSADAMELNVNSAINNPAPARILEKYRATDKRYTIAARLRGSPISAYPQGAPIPEQSTIKPLTKALRPVELIVIGDVDFLEDGFYVDPQSKTPVADNAALVVNAIESLSGTDSLLTLRARTAPPRPMTRLDTMRAKTAERLAVEEARLAKELQDTEARLRVLRSQAENRTGFGVQATSVNEIERFQAKAFDIRGRLREIRRSYTIDIERLRNQLLALNTLAAPMLLALIGIGVALRRRFAVKKRPSS